MPTTTEALIIDIQAKNEDKVKGLKTQIREATQEVAAMTQKYGEFDARTTEALKKLSQLRDVQGDINDRVKALSPDRFERIATIGQGLVGGFQTFSGVMGVLGVQSEDFEKTMIKLQSLTNISQGLQSFKVLYEQLKAGNMQLGIMTGLQKANAAATAVATTVQRAFGVAVDTTSTSFKVLKGAIVATGIGALVVVIALVVEKFNEMSDAAKKAKESTQDTMKYLNEVQDIDDQAFRQDMAKARQRGASEEELYGMRKRHLEGRLALLKFQRESVTDTHELDKAIAEESIALEELKADRAEKMRSDAQKKRDEDLRRAKEEQDKRIQQQKEELESRKAFEERVLEIEETFRKANIDAENQKRHDEFVAVQTTNFKMIKLEEERIAAINARNEYRKQKEKEAQEYTALLQQMELNGAQALAGNLSQLLGTQTTAGKAFALAEVGISEGRALASALANANSPTPDNVASGGLAGIAKFLTIAASITATALKARNIIKSGAAPGGGLQAPASAGANASTSFSSRQLGTGTDGGNSSSGYGAPVLVVEDYNKVNRRVTRTRSIASME
jgi:hypothetical protein